MKGWYGGIIQVPHCRCLYSQVAPLGKVQVGFASRTSWPQAQIPSLVPPLLEPWNLESNEEPLLRPRPDS